MNNVIWVLLTLGGIQCGIRTDSIEDGLTVDDNIPDNDQLIFAHVIFRHGERNIDRSNPNDPYQDESYWPGGYGALTNAGKKEEYELGQYLRRRYRKLIGTHYSPKKVYIRSTSYDRALMSAQLVAAGLFPPNDDEVWLEDLNWQPIPIHSVPLDQEHLLAWTIPCPRFKSLFQNYTQSPERKALIEKHKSSIEQWEKNAGKKFVLLVDVMYLFDTLYVEDRAGLVLPKWAETALKANKTLEYLAAAHLETFTHTTELKKLEAGTIIKEMLDRFRNKSLSVLNPDRSLWIYAAHDLTLINILNALNLYELHIPAYASSLHFELFKDESQFYVQFSYKRSAVEDAEPQVIPNCGIRCPLDKFYELYSEILPTEDYESMCHL